MDWYNHCRLVEFEDGYTLEICLNKNSLEIADEFYSDTEKTAERMDEKIRRLVQEKYANFKIKSVKLLIGSLIVATIPFVTLTSAAAAGSTSVSVQQTQIVNGTGTVVATRLNVRSGPSTSNSIMTVLSKWEQVKVTGESGNWYKIKLSNGSTGWVSRYYLRITSVQEKKDKVISTAYSLVGTPYVWGGESPAEGGFDCSGLVQYVFKQVGYSMNRVSADQVKQGVYVAQSDLKAGDLVFYSIKQNGVVDHVGIYLGNGKMIHSPKPGDTVKITNVAVTYWQNRYITARRIIY